MQVDDVPYRHAEPVGQLLPHARLDRVLGPADQHLRLDPHLHEELRAVLRGLALLLVQMARLDDPHQVDEEDVALALLIGKVAHRRDVRPVFLVADRAADLHQRDVGAGRLRRLAHEAHQLAGDVREELHVRSRELAAPLQRVDTLAEPTVGEVVVLRHAPAHEPLVGADVHVALGAVVEDEHLAVAVRAQRAGVLVVIAVHLDQVGGEPAVGQQARQGGREDALAQPAHHAAGDDDEARLTDPVAVRQGAVALAGVGDVAQGAQRAGHRPVAHAACAHAA